MIYIHIFQTWQLQSTNGQNINLTFESFDVHASHDCWADYVEITYGSFNQKFCNRYTNRPGPIPGPFSSETTITVKFHTSPTGISNGFLAIVCCAINVTSNMNESESLY